jgi:small subunit ribosomal protein S8
MYTVGDFLIQIKNAYFAGKKQIDYPFSKEVFSIGKVLEKEGYLGKVSEKGSEGKKAISISLKYVNRLPAISEIKLVSKPSARRYINKSKLLRAAAKHGIAILTTNRGVMTNKQASKEGVGGEIVCQIY